MQFTELSLGEGLLQGIADAGFTECTAVQERTFTETLESRDVYVQSQTGSGKTAAFLISIFEHFQRSTFERNRALIIVPTRELAVQIEEEAKLLGGHLPFRIGSFYGGVGYDKQLDMLEKGYEIIIGTPGRLIDLDQRRKLNFGDSSIVVIDEADRLFDMGFLPDLQKMFRRMPKREQRLTMLYSATLNGRVWQLAWEHMNDPIQIVLNPENLTVSEVHQELYHVSASDKFKLLLGLLDREKAQNVLIFTNTKSGAEEVSRRLEYNDYQSRFIIGDLPQKKRLALIEQMKAGKLQILVATDVAARGLHINDLPLVINYDLPEDPEGYVHRIGRTARAGNTGKAVTLACERFVYSLEAIEELIDSKIPIEWHDDSMLLADKSEGIRIETNSRGSGSRNRRSSSDRGRRRPDHGRGRDSRPQRSSAGRSRPARSPNAGKPVSGGDRKVQGDRKTTSDKPQRPSQQDRRPQERRPQARRPQNKRPQDGRPQDQRSNRPGRDADDRRPDRSGRASDERRTPSKSGTRKSAPSANAPMEERLAHYREKYGEDFKMPAESAGKSTGSRKEKSKKTTEKNSRNTQNAVEKPGKPKKGGKKILSKLFRRKKGEK